MDLPRDDQRGSAELLDSAGPPAPPRGIPVLGDRALALPHPPSSLGEDPGRGAARHGPRPVSGHGSPAPGARLLRPGHLSRGRRVRGKDLSGPGRAGGLYVHYPFCAAKCPYCHFYSEALSGEGLRTWRRGLEKEAAAAGASGLRFDTLYLGGGTPSLLGPDDVARVREIAEARFRAEVTEFTLEANPCGPGAEFLRGWRAAGVTRLSVGVQSFDDGILRTLARPYAAAEAIRFCRTAREAGFEALAVDLMTGIPGETPESGASTVRTLLELEPDHVSLYFLENVERLPFEATLARHPVDEDSAVEGFRKMRDSLEAAGLRQYEISNFAHEGKECRHNLKYWRYEPFLGLGPSACSHVGGKRWCNRPSLADWSGALERGEDPRGETVDLDPQQSVREALSFGLRLVEGVDLPALRERFGVDIAALRAREIDELLADGLLIRDGGHLRIPVDRLLVSNAILSRLI
ncbi:MAG: radical SAM family heme chaperone HemW [Candidatus Aminicenantes bacterium]|nr:radical SAM family heme chaperone HemW [Candidatus Aminicenantes bacterium]